MDAGVGFADPSIVDRISTGVDVTADNTTYRQLSPPTPNARRPRCGRRVPPRWCAANFARYVDAETAAVESLAEAKHCLDEDDKREETDHGDAQCGDGFEDGAVLGRA